MIHEDVHPAGAPTVGSAGTSVRNVSGETKTIGSTVRHTERAADGKFSRALPHRAPVMVRETVTGQMLPGEDHSVLTRANDGLAEERLHRVAPDYSGGRAISASLNNGAYSRGLSAAFAYAATDDSVRSNAGLMPAENLLNHIVSCPCLTTGGACCG